MKQKIAKLIDLKSIITIVITACLVYGFVVGKVNMYLEHLIVMAL